MKPKVLITGAFSLLGKYLTVTLHATHTLFLTGAHLPADQSFKHANQMLQMDITDKLSVQETIQKIQPDYVIHLAGLSNIDYCEANKELSEKVNVEGTRNILTATQSSATRLLFASSSMVFDGQDAPFSEDSLPRPLNVYGNTKYAAEQIIQASSQPYSIMRFSTLFGWPPKTARSNDLVRYLADETQSSPLHLVDDLFFNPISAHTAAIAVGKLMASNLQGVLHISGKETVNRYEFVKKIFDAFNIKKHRPLLAVSHTHFPHLAPRPKDSTLSQEKMKSILNFEAKTLRDEFAFLRINNN